MAIEHASVQVARKPGTLVDLRAWSKIDDSGDANGEPWFRRADKDAAIASIPAPRSIEIVEVRA